MGILIKLVLTAVAFWVATKLVPGVTVTGGAGDYLVVAVVFALVNLVVRPIAKLLSLPFVLLTLGLFLLVVNAAMLELTDALTDRLTIDRFWHAVLAAIVISLVTWGGENVVERQRS